MDIDIVSDLHIEFNHDSFYDRMIKESTSKEIIIAGDIGCLRKPETRKAFINLTNKYERVIYVPGNHDYYGIDIEEGDKILTILEENIPNLIVLRPNKSIFLGKYKVIGATLWVPYSEDLNKYPINDPNFIRNLYSHLDKMNSEASKFIYNNTDENTIVVTHHLPHPECINPIYASDRTNCWFLSNENKIS